MIVYLAFKIGKSNSRGVAILFSNDLDFTVHNHISDPEGNYIIVDITLDNTRLTLISLHAPNQDSSNFFDKLYIDGRPFQGGDNL